MSSEPNYWKPRVSNGMLAWATSDNWSRPCWRIQMYWPEIVVKHTEFRVHVDNILRVTWASKQRGFGFKVMGFGFGIVREPKGLSAEG